MGTGRDSPVTGWYSQGIPRLKRGVDDLKTSMQKMIIRALVASRSHSILVAFLWRSSAKTWRIMLNKPHHYWRFHWAWVIMPCFGGGSNPLAPTSIINRLDHKWSNLFSFYTFHGYTRELLGDWTCFISSRCNCIELFNFPTPPSNPTISQPPPYPYPPISWWFLLKLYIKFSQTVSDFFIFLKVGRLKIF